jgi:hypothetical protein
MRCGERQRQSCGGYIISSCCLLLLPTYLPPIISRYPSCFPRGKRIKLLGRNNRTSFDRNHLSLSLSPRNEAERFSSTQITTRPRWRLLRWNISASRLDGSLLRSRMRVGISGKLQKKHSPPISQKTSCPLLYHEIPHPVLPPKLPDCDLNIKFSPFQNSC